MFNVLISHLLSRKAVPNSNFFFEQLALPWPRCSSSFHLLSSLFLPNLLFHVNLAFEAFHFLQGSFKLMISFYLLA